jgi:hypothetical protein
MTDVELREIVRAAVARHLGRAALPSAPPVPAVLAPTLAPVAQVPHAAHSWQQHASHHLYVSLVNVDGSCVIEPSVNCDHCGYCKSHGH